MQVKLALNQITPENYKKKEDELISLVQANIDNEDNLIKIIGVVYKKAQMEQKYGEVYSKLVLKLLNKEKEIKGLSNRKSTKMREELLILCRRSFELFGNPLGTNDQDPDHFEKVTLYKKKLIGNMIFIGNLFKVNVIVENLIKTIFDEFFKMIDQKN
jgi:hypothetical protein